MLLDFAYTLTFFIIALPMVVFFGAQPDDRLVWVVAFLYKDGNHLTVAAAGADQAAVV